MGEKYNNSPSKSQVDKYLKALEDQIKPSTQSTENINPTTEEVEYSLRNVKFDTEHDEISHPEHQIKTSDLQGFSEADKSIDLVKVQAILVMLPPDEALRYEQPKTIYEIESLINMLSATLPQLVKSSSEETITYQKVIEQLQQLKETYM